MTDPRFLDAFFDIVHRKVENDGIDFWWLDCEQHPIFESFETDL